MPRTQITGSQILNGTVSPADIENGTPGYVLTSGSTMVEWQPSAGGVGPTGPTGPAGGGGGATGATGATGLASPVLAQSDVLIPQKLSQPMTLISPTDAGEFIWAIDTNNSNAVVKVNKNTLVATGITGGGPVAITALAFAHGKVWGTDGSQLFAIDPTTEEVVGTYTYDNGEAVQYSSFSSVVADGAYLWMAAKMDTGDTTVHFLKINPVDGAKVADVPTGGSSSNLWNTRLWNSAGFIRGYRNGYVYTLTLNGETATENSTTEASFFAVVNGRIFHGYPAQNKIDEFDASTYALIGTVVSFGDGLLTNLDVVGDRLAFTICGTSVGGTSFYTYNVTEGVLDAMCDLRDTRSEGSITLPFLVANGPKYYAFAGGRISLLFKTADAPVGYSIAGSGALLLQGMSRPLTDDTTGQALITNIHAIGDYLWFLPANTQSAVQSPTRMLRRTLMVTDTLSTLTGILNLDYYHGRLWATTGTDTNIHAINPTTLAVTTYNFTSVATNAISNFTGVVSDGTSMWVLGTDTTTAEQMWVNFDPATGAKIAEYIVAATVQTTAPMTLHYAAGHIVGANQPNNSWLISFNTATQAYLEVLDGTRRHIAVVNNKFYVAPMLGYTTYVAEIDPATLADISTVYGPAPAYCVIYGIAAAGDTLAIFEDQDDYGEVALKLFNPTSGAITGVCHLWSPSPAFGQVASIYVEKVGDHFYVGNTAIVALVKASDYAMMVGPTGPAGGGGWTTYRKTYADFNTELSTLPALPICDIPPGAIVTGVKLTPVVQFAGTTTVGAPATAVSGPLVGVSMAAAELSVTIDGINQTATVSGSTAEDVLASLVAAGFTGASGATASVAMLTGVTATSYGSSNFGACQVATDGTDLWFADLSNSGAQKMDPTGAFTAYAAIGQSAAISFDGTDMWVANLGGMIHKITTAGVVTTYNVPYELSVNHMTYACGSTYGGGYTWFVCQWTPIGGNAVKGLIRVAPDGSMVGYPCLKHFWNQWYDRHHVVFDGTNLWVTTGEAVLYKVTTAGVSTRYSIPGAIGPLAFDGTHLWVASAETGTVYKVGLDGAIVASYMRASFAGSMGSIMCHSNGDVWVSDANQPGNITIIKPNGTLQTIPQPISAGSELMTEIGDTVWATSTNVWQVDILTLATCYSIASPSPRLLGFISVNPRSAGAVELKFGVNTEPLDSQNYSMIMSPQVGGAYGKGIATDGTNMYVAYQYAGVWVYNQDLDVLATLGGVDACGVAYDGANIWATSNGENKIHKMGATGSVASYAVGAAPWGIAFDGTNMWTANAGDNTVSKVGPTGTVDTYSLTSQPIQLVFDGTNMWSGLSDGSLSKIASDGTETNYPGIGTAAGSYGIAFDGTHLWLTNSGEAYLRQIDLTGTVVNSYAIPSAAGGIGISGDRVYLGDGSGGVTVVDRLTGDVLYSLVGTQFISPTGFAVAPNGQVWSSNALSSASILPWDADMKVALSEPYPSTSIAALDLTLDLAGDGAQTISLAANTTAADIAADIQTKVRALTANTPANQAAYDKFTCIFLSHRYWLASPAADCATLTVDPTSPAANPLKLGTVTTAAGMSIAGTESVHTVNSLQIDVTARPYLYSLNWYSLNAALPVASDGSVMLYLDVYEQAPIVDNVYTLTLPIRVECNVPLYSLSAGAVDISVKMDVTPVP